MLRQRPFLVQAAAAFSALTLPGLAASEDRPNIVMIIVDDMAWASTSITMDTNIPESASDFHQTPRLEELASQGVVFSNGYSAGPICSPSRAALMSGISPAQLNVTDLRQGGSNTNDHFRTKYNGFPLTPPQPRQSLPDESTIADHINNLGHGYRNGF